MKRKSLLLLAFLLMSIGLITAQVKRVTGTVISEEDGEPIVGASILVKGTTLGTVTDIDGQFTISEIPASSQTLVVSYIGMQSQEVTAKAQMMKIVLKADTEVLDEVVVVAYGTAKKGSLTGAVSSVGSETIEKNISTSVTGALEGTSPGVQVNNTYGEPGSAPSIRIRGFGSVNGSNSPLYVVDGIPFDGNIADLNSNDIESLTVLKDASSAALYGSRAANGVILITTKKAKSMDKPTVTFTTNHGAYTRGIKEYARLDADRWMEAQWTGMKNYAMSLAGYNAEDAAAYASEYLIEDLVKRNIYDAPDNQLFDANGKLVANKLAGYTDLDWADELEKTGYRQEYGLSVASNTDKYNVYASLGYLKENGYIINTGFERYSGRVNTTFTPTKWFKTGLNIAATSQAQNYNSAAYSSYYSNPFYATRYNAPVYPIYSHNADGSIMLDENGNKVFDTTSDYLSNRHIIFERLNDVEKNQRLTVDATAFATFVLPYGFDFTVKGAKNYTDRRRSKYDNPEIGDGASSNGRLSNYDYRYQTTNFQQQLNWAHDYGVHHVDAMLAHESYKYESNVVYGMNTNMSVAGNVTMGNFANNSYYSGYSDEDTTESYLARARYNYMSKYFIEGSFRTDGSSRFHPDNRWGNFFSVGAAWDITQEKFMKGVKWVDFLKLRASYGEVGNNFVNDGSGSSNYYAYQALYYLDKFGGNGALIKQSLAANNVKWETTQTVDVAVEANLFGRLNLQFGYFDKRSKDLLFSVPLASSAGNFFGSDDYTMTQLMNVGSVSNRGFELAADVDILKKKNFKWTAGVDATFLKNKIQKLPDHEEIALGSYRRYAEGKSLYEFYTYHFEGVDQMTGNSLYTINPAQAAAADKAGKLVNINGVDYTTDVTYGQKDWAGSALPTVYGSVRTGLEYKGIALNVLMTYSLGGKVMDTSYYSLMSTSGNSAEALHEDILKSWNGIPEGMTATSANRIDPNGIPVIDHNLSTYNNAMSDRWLTSASYLVMKNITLSYELPKLMVRNWGLQGVTVNAGVENAFTITARQGLNPQYGFSGTQDATYTTARIFNVGATVKF
jgi:TonB-linked SusC/RagA family outer membrane protein